MHVQCILHLWVSVVALFCLCIGSTLLCHIMYYSKNHNTAVKPKCGNSGRHTFRAFDWIMVSIMAFDWLSNNTCHASNIWIHMTCSTVMVFAVGHGTIKVAWLSNLSCNLTQQHICMTNAITATQLATVEPIYLSRMS